MAEGSRECHLHVCKIDQLTHRIGDGSRQLFGGQVPGGKGPVRERENHSE